MTTYLPYYSSPPNKVLSYRLEPFDDGHGHKAQLRIVTYLDKNKVEKEAIAQVMWENV